MAEGEDEATAFAVLPFPDLFLTFFSATGCFTALPIRERGKKMIHKKKHTKLNAENIQIEDHVAFLHPHFQYR